ncbi:MAG TPA: ferric reductase-like transmembrane domain-containing protein [Phycisphaerae bacterium]|nr:ferric reductase-like transmembrane domain-containing protein [Phycisphaerae bacterium]
MSVGYVAVQWSRHKRIYDACVAGGIAVYLGVFLAVGKTLHAAPNAISDEILAMRALGTCAFLLLNMILCIGPLARLDRRFLPLLYNRRHLGVATFLVALLHGAIAIGFYHGFGNVNPFVSLLTSNTNYGSLSAFPFQILGLLALLILFLMAATSHDFWLKNLGAPAWKRLHMLVYVAYGLLVMHVALGFLQTQRSPWLAALVGAGVVTVSSLHLIAGIRERRHDGRGSERAPATGEKWVDVGSVDDIAEQRGSTATIGESERIAIFRINGCISATTNVCAHQGGPIGEGKIIDGCITCPWHGWQYRPEDGQSPPPFKERIATYRVRVVGRRIEIDPAPLPPGTPVEPARVEEAHHG